MERCRHRKGDGRLGRRRPRQRSCGLQLQRRRGGRRRSGRLRRWLQQAGRRRGHRQELRRRQAGWHRGRWRRHQGQRAGSWRGRQLRITVQRRIRLLQVLHHAMQLDGRCSGLQTGQLLPSCAAPPQCLQSNAGGPQTQKVAPGDFATPCRLHSQETLRQARIRIIWCFRFAASLLFTALSQLVLLLRWTYL
jgi:hypothetical protein